MIGKDKISTDEIRIEAPVELVWKILVDFENYGKWNKFCPQATAKLEVGSPIHMVLNFGNGPQPWVEYISHIEPNKAIAWRMENKPGDPVHAVRTQTLTKLSETSCSYLSVDEFSGEGVPQMIAESGQAVEDGFNVCAQGLKQYAEQLAI
ncbi:SRPBCC domain-containing protein [Pseudomaricurvus alkylphenolicus]|uniref:SRPBCC domain-containing protein n=1 Tax=Pseudomaricurvus alkylphenolicus TaxID=1306991 RepID=UPI001421CC17|nr:SRPBCC domain-containing protein [Pseudomaricurvus alkylphenolicus]NIB45179.1 SRPBCC domain-containing protein [Pseudomaricurvus alkylphenolicus]